MHQSGRLALLIPLLSFAGCSGKSQRPVFKILSSGQTGISFANTITTSDSLNVQNDPYVYNGAGVAIGDINNDGFPDIFFSGNIVSSRLYRNKGHMKFEDITERAGVSTNRWATGATMVDINGDGYLRVRLGSCMVERRTTGKFPVRQQRERQFHREGRPIRHRGYRIHNARRIS
jgi:hypothetical protein